MTDYRTTADFAKLVRADIKAALKAGKLPKGLKVSVRSDSYSMGSSINLKIVAVPAGFVIRNPAHIAHLQQNPHDSYWTMPEGVREFYTPEAIALQDKVESFVLAYHVDNSTDDGGDKCWNVNFHTSTGYAWEVEKADRESTEARLKAERAAAELAPVAADDKPAKPRVVVHLVEWTPAPRLRLVK